MLKINVDDAFVNVLKDPVGAVCPYENGQYRCASTTIYAGLTNPTTLEVVACIVVTGFAPGRDTSYMSV